MTGSLTRYRPKRTLLLTVSLPPNVREAFAALSLAPTAPVGLISAARRYWVREYHPDHGGEATRMVVLNNAADVAEEWARTHQRQSCAATGAA